MAALVMELRRLVVWFSHDLSHYSTEFARGQWCMWDWGDGLTLIGTGVTDSAAASLRTIASLGRNSDELTEIVLRRCHDDHIGGAAKRVERSRPQVLAHRSDAPVIRGERSRTPPVLEDFERPIAEAVLPRVPRAQRLRVDREIDDGETTSGCGVVIAVPATRQAASRCACPRAGTLAAPSYSRKDVHPAFSCQRRSSATLSSRASLCGLRIA